MAADKWNGVGDWEVNSIDWSSGIPTLFTPVEIQSGTATISDGGVGEAQSLTIDTRAEVSLSDDALLNITDWLDNAGEWRLDGGDSVSIGTRLINSGAIYIGNNEIAASTTVTAASLTNSNTGVIDLQGNASSGATEQATLDITDSNSSIVAGSIYVLGDADLELATGVTKVASTGSLEVYGQQARISLGAGSSNNALSGLTYNAGTIDFEGNTASGFGGTTILTAVGFTNAAGGRLSVDADSSSGGTTVNFDGAFFNAGTVDIGSSELGADGSGGDTTVTATSLDNVGVLNLLGNGASDATGKATLDITGAASFASNGRIQVGGDATLEFGSGGITSVGTGGWFELDGSGAAILTGGGASSALSGFATNYGTFLLRGDSDLGSGGATLTTKTSFTNYGFAYVDGYQDGDGGSTATFGGTLTNDGTLDIGGTDLSASTTVIATTLVNNGSLTLQGNTTSGTPDKATLDLTGAAEAISTGYVQIGGAATLEFAKGGITSVGAGGWFELDGSGAEILTDGGAFSALSGFAANYGTLLLGGDSDLGSGGVTLTTKTSFTNYSIAYVDAYDNGEGGSKATFGGTLTNEGTLEIGNEILSASTTVNATTFVNNGSLTLQGNTTSGTTDKATLDLTGAASSTSTGYARVSGDATVEFGSGGITSIGDAGWLELDGSGAAILTGGGASSALSGFATNYGTFLLRGDSDLGSGGATLTTKTSFTNYYIAYVDGYHNGDGGSTATFGGTLTNDGTLDIGNETLSASTTVNATTFVNNGSLTLQGNTTSGTTDKATFDLAGAAASISTGYVRVSGDATLEFGSGGITSIGNGGWFELDGSGAAILAGGGASSALSGFATNYGTLLLRGNNVLGSGGATLITKTSFTNYYIVYVDGYPNGDDGGSTATFGGTLTNDFTLDIGNTGLSASTTVNATTLVNNGSLTLQGNTTSGTTDKATLDLTGAAASTSTGYMRVGGDATVEFGSGGITSIGNGGWLELDGSRAKILTSGGTSSALSGIATNYGTLLLRGDSNYGPGGASLTTTKAFTNSLAVYVDSYDNGDGGSTAIFRGTLTNKGAFDIGNRALSAATTVTADGLSNDGALTLVGSSSFLAGLVVNGAATTDGAVTIGANSELDVTGSNSFTQAGGSMTVAGLLVASTIHVDDGLLDFAEVITSGDGVGALDIGDQGDLEFGSSVDSTHSVAFTAPYGTLSLGDAGAFSATIKGFSGHDAIDLLGQTIAGLSFSGGALTVSLSDGATENLVFSGGYATPSFTFASDGHGGSNILHT